MNYLPSRKFVIIVLAILSAGGGWFLFFSGNNTEKYGNSGTEKLTGGIMQWSLSQQKDSDSDGLTDWEEVLWKTDLNNPDSDEDGTPDGEEVKGGRNPAVAGPDDKIKNMETFGDNGDVKKLELTKTDIFARQFFSLFFSLQQSGNLNEQTKQKLTESFLEKMTKESVSDTYILIDLTITEDGGNSLKKYGNKVAEIINKYQPSGETEIETEIAIIARALKNEDKDEIGKIKPIIKIYENIERDLLAMDVPEKMARYHLEFLNGFLNLSKILHDISRTFEDPLVGIIAINQYPREYFRIRSAFAGISGFFSDNGVFFRKSEGGYVFMNK